MQSDTNVGLRDNKGSAPMKHSGRTAGLMGIILKQV